MTEVVFGEWLPDAPTLGAPVVMAKNVVAGTGGYGPFPGANGTGDTTTETVAGSKLFIRDDATPLVCAGSETRLIVRDSGGVSETTGLTGLGSGHVWHFERFDDYIVAVTPNNAPQYLTDLDSDTSFSALPGSPPKAAVLGRVGDFLVMGDLTDIDASVRPYRLRWSAQNNPTASWTTDLGNLSGSLDLPPEYGKITGIVRGAVGIVFQERAIWRLDFVGAPQVFDPVAISTDKGCVASGSIVTFGGVTHFLSQDGFNVTDGAGVSPTSGRRVAKWFEASNDAAQKNRVHGALNWPRRAIVWAFVPSGGTDFTQQIVFAFDENKWTHADATIDYLVQTKTDAVTLSDLAVLYPGGIGDWTGTVGDVSYLSKDLALGAWTASGNGSELAVMNGDNLAASIRSGDAFSGRRVHITGAMPFVENDSMNTRMQVHGRDTQSGSTRSTSDTGEGADGYCPQKIDVRFGAVQMNIPAGSVWDNARGCDVKMRVSGKR